MGRDPDGDRAHAARDRVISAATTRASRNRPVCANRCVPGEDPRRGAAPPGEPERDVEEGLVDEIGEKRAEEERALLEGGEAAVRPRRDLLADAEMPEREHAVILNVEQRSAKRGDEY